MSEQLSVRRRADCCAVPRCAPRRTSRAAAAALLLLPGGTPALITWRKTKVRVSILIVKARLRNEI